MSKSSLKNQVDTVQKLFSTLQHLLEEVKMPLVHLHDEMESINLTRHPIKLGTKVRWQEELAAITRVLTQLQHEVKEYEKVLPI